MSHDYAPAVWIPSGHRWPGRDGHRPRWIIIHGTAMPGSAEDIARFFQTNDPPTSTHYVIGRDGRVVQCVAEQDAAWGNGPISAGHDPWWTPSLNPNLVTVSIEHCKPDPENRDELTPEQRAASFALVAHLSARWRIAPVRATAAGGITGHFSMNPVHRAFCPGPYPWDDLFAHLVAGSNTR